MASQATSDAIAVALDEERALRPVARDVLRSWLRTGNDAAFDRIGETAIRDAADLTARAYRAQDSGVASAILADIEIFAARLVAPAPARSRWWGRSEPRESTDPPAADDLTPLIARLDREQDAMTRRMILLGSDRARFVAIDEALRAAVHLVRALRPVVDAAVREIRMDDPQKAQAIEEKAASILLERETAILTQYAVHHQGLMTLDLIVANQTVLAKALDQARTATLSALRIAIAARRATADDAALSRQRLALERTADQARSLSSDGSAAAQRRLADALEQARAAIGAITDRSAR